MKLSQECVKSGAFGHQAGTGADAWQQVSTGIYLTASLSAPKLAKMF